MLVRDGVCVLGLAPVAYAPGLGAIGAEFGDLPVRPYDPLGVALAVLLWLPLAVRRRWPALCLGLVAGAFAAHELLGFPPTFAGVGLYAALYSVGAHQERFRVGLAVWALAAYVPFAFGLWLRGSPQGVADYVTICGVLALCWGAGGWVRARQAGEAERRRRGVREARERERARIARELHDVVTHHVTAMVVQADAAQYLRASAPDRAATALATISDSGRRALGDLQDLLGVLRAPEGERDGTGRGLADVPELVERVRGAGQPVELFVEPGAGGAETEVGGGEGVLYRVVQEGLTNALKHATGRPTAVRVVRGRAAVEVEVTTEGPGAGETPVVNGVDGGGRGLAGLRERVGELGGALAVVERADGGFGIRARVPVGEGNG